MMKNIFSGVFFIGLFLSFNVSVYSSRISMPVKKPFNHCPDCGFYFSEFAQTPNPYGWPLLHPGKDANFPGDNGSPLYAIADGQVSCVSPLGGTDGNTPTAWGSIVIRHTINGETLYSQYGHAQTIYVRTGDSVKRGQLIGEVGEVGAAGFPHLHWEIRTANHPAALNNCNASYWNHGTRNPLTSEQYSHSPPTDSEGFQNAHNIYTWYRNPEETVINASMNAKRNESLYLHLREVANADEQFNFHSVPWYNHYPQDNNGNIIGTTFPFNIFSYYSYTKDNSSEANDKNCYIKVFVSPLGRYRAIVYDHVDIATESYSVGYPFLQDQSVGWMTHGGPTSVMRMPTSNEFIAKFFPLTLRQNFKYGYLSYNFGEHTVRMYNWANQQLFFSENPAEQDRPAVYVPGGFQHQGTTPKWESMTSYLFTDAYNRNTSFMVYYVPDDHVSTNEPRNTYEQLFVRSNNNSYLPVTVLIVANQNEREVDYSNLSIPALRDANKSITSSDLGGRNAYILRYFLNEYYQNFGQYGLPISDEISITAGQERAIVQYFENRVLVYNQRKTIPRQAYTYEDFTNNWCLYIYNLAETQSQCNRTNNAALRSRRLVATTALLVQQGKLQVPGINNREDSLLYAQRLELVARNEDSLTNMLGDNQDESQQKPDLTLKILTINNLPPQEFTYLAGSPSLGIQSIVTNKGQGTSVHESTLTFVISKDDTYSADDYVFEKVYLPFLLPNQSYNFQILFDLPQNFSSGTYYLIAYADGEFNIEEENENNNYHVVRVHITGAMRDIDKDGYFSIETGGTDCDDANSDVYPGKTDRANNGIDEDCNGFDYTREPLDWIANPIDNVQTIIENMSPGDTLIFGPGIYHIQGQLYSNKKIFITSSQGPEKTIIDGTGVFNASIVFEGTNANNSILEGVTVMNAPDHCIEILGTALLIKNVIIHDCSRSGIHIINMPDVIAIESALIYNNGQDGVQVFDSQVALQASTLVNNRGYGMWATGGHKLWLYANIFAYNYLEGLDVPTATDPRIYRNIIYGNGRNNNAWILNNPEVIQEDPRFINREAGNYKLSPYSPAIDRCYNCLSNPVQYDYNNDPRVVGSSMDIGADEFTRESYAKDLCKNLEVETGMYEYHQWMIEYAPLQQVIDQCISDGDRLFVHPGIYAIPSGIDFKGKNFKLFSVKGAEKTILDGKQSALRCVFIGSGENYGAHLKGFTIENCVYYGIDIRNSSPQISSNILRNNGSFGFLIENSPNNSTLVISNLIYKNGRGGGYVLNSKTSIQGNTIVQNSDFGIWIDNPVAPSDYCSSCDYYNIYAYNQGIGLKIGTSNTSWKMRVYRSDFYKNGIPQDTNYFDEGSVAWFENPQFRNYEVEDYYLLENSYVVNKVYGDYTNPLDYDVHGNSRRICSSMDLGALENQEVTCE